jgi:hypothetical protein
LSQPSLHFTRCHVGGKLILKAGPNLTLDGGFFAAAVTPPQKATKALLV